MSATAQVRHELYNAMGLHNNMQLQYAAASAAADVVEQVLRSFVRQLEVMLHGAAYDTRMPFPTNALLLRPVDGGGWEMKRLAFDDTKPLLVTSDKLLTVVEGELAQLTANHLRNDSGEDAP